ncbi:MAG TPA: hypothetical protein VIF57_27455, partial [Polyangia bacterium]
MKNLWLLAAIAVIGCGSSSSSGNPGTAGSGSPGTGGSGTGTGGNTGTGGSGTGTGGQVIGSSGCPLFTADDVWNADVSGKAVDSANTTKMYNLIDSNMMTKIHPDFGPGFGIPITIVPQSQAKVPIVFDDYPDESDPGPYPFPGA